ncbi:vWA domain-containing protein [Sporosarcina sp. CAU 1771]
MGFNNLAFAWTALFPIAVLLYYFFRKKYETRSISSTLFWEQSMKETKVSPYLKELQRNALFYLQMAALLLFLIVLLAPFITKKEIASKQTIFVVDTSASMLVEKDGISLFEAHKESMKKLVSSSDSQQITIVTTGKEPETIIREEKNNDVVKSAIDNLGATYDHEHISRAIEFAKSIATGNGTEIQIFTDFLDRTSLPDGDGSLVWSVHGSEGAVSNVSIDKFGAIQRTDTMESIVKIVNHDDKLNEGVLLIKDALTDKLIAEEKFEVEPKQDHLLSFKDLPLTRAIQAEIKVDDGYKADNTAYFLLGNEYSDVLVDGNLHQLVKTAFEAIGLPVSTGSLTNRDKGAIVVTNDVSLLSEGLNPVVLIGRNDESSKPISGVAKSFKDALFTVSDIGGIYVSELYPPIEGFTTIATVGDEPFIQKSVSGDIAILSDIEMTDWPLHPSFPLFIWSAVEMIHSEANSLGNFAPNERRAVIGSEMEIYTAKDEFVTTILQGASFKAPAMPGIYKARENGAEKLFMVGLEDIEKELKEGASFRVNQVDRADGIELGKKMVGSLLILPILLLLLIEWEVQRRRGYPN